MFINISKRVTWNIRGTQMFQAFPEAGEKCGLSEAAYAKFHFE
ncbi:MAG: hypothetical protein AAF443_08525 [Chlamydiota bacterium]